VYYAFKDIELSMKNRLLSLTPDHVARIHRTILDPGPEAHIVYHSDADYEAIVRYILASRPTYDEIWLFAYGSLIWKPEVEHLAEQSGVARGWHRSYCFKVTRFRGSREQPGLMMALDRGGQCRGVLYRLDATDLEATLGKLFRREFTSQPPNSMPRWIPVESERGPLSALTFVMNRQSPAYVGKLALEAVADVLASACGHWGSGAEYLLNTVQHLGERGIHDRNLWRLQQLVAERLDFAAKNVLPSGR
jgi:glutathione-specific gamma-glutamylcyclotransferase